LILERQPLVLPDPPNHMLSMALVMDSLARWRRAKCLIIVDGFTKECLYITVAMGISGEKVVRTLMVLRPCKPTRKPLEPTKVRHALTQREYRYSGSRDRMGTLRALNGKFRDECLNEHWFRDVAHMLERR
jgi:putative transposase